MLFLFLTTSGFFFTPYQCFLYLDHSFRLKIRAILI